MAAATAVALPLAGTHGAQLPDGMGERARQRRDGARRSASGSADAHQELGGSAWPTLLVTLALFAGGLALGVARLRPQPAAAPRPSATRRPAASPPRRSSGSSRTPWPRTTPFRSAPRWSGDPYRLLAGEIQSWNMQGVTSSARPSRPCRTGHGPSTEIIITGRTAAGDPLVFNLVVHVTDNQIVNFR